VILKEGCASVKSARTQTFVDAAQVACALERYRLVDGTLPDDLSALTPQFISSIPTDVIDGEPLRYRKTGDDSYIIYSVGWNQTDDGGEVGWTSDRETSVDISKGDWVWFGD
jgi:hypothetical protein